MKKIISPVSIFEQSNCQLIEVKNDKHKQFCENRNQNWNKANMKDISFFNMVQKIEEELDNPQTDVKVTKDPHNQMII